MATGSVARLTLRGSRQARQQRDPVAHGEPARRQGGVGPHLGQAVVAECRSVPDREGRAAADPEHPSPVLAGRGPAARRVRVQGRGDVEALGGLVVLAPRRAPPPTGRTGSPGSPSRARGARRADAIAANGLRAGHAGRARAAPRTSRPGLPRTRRTRAGRSRPCPRRAIRRDARGVDHLGVLEPRPGGPHDVEPDELGGGLVALEHGVHPGVADDVEPALDAGHARRRRRGRARRRWSGRPCRGTPGSSA